MWYTEKLRNSEHQLREFLVSFHVNEKHDSTNPRKGCTAIVKALRLELFVVLVEMQVNKSHPLANILKLANSPFVLPKDEILAESKFAAPTITKLIPISFNTGFGSILLMLMLY
ncbi:hypothetical protein JRO89_XS04G0208200 [Xanthoceras sorbifolium]|uniref:Uncharacterized protein n=1 Tax=Xanthoceras sorbifolium TaxID=99658 RepID=A0ABQ8I676_9ROSI|nr:hypothetical protein JRO89_XS04G0208200 [Xanthoceras sorbifolium]